MPILQKPTKGSLVIIYGLDIYSHNPFRIGVVSIGELSPKNYDTPCTELFSESKDLKFIKLMFVRSV